MKRPTITLPQSLSDAFDRVMASDREWFRTHPETRWRVRSVDPAELQSNELVSLFAADDGCHGCSRCAPYVLVINWPSGRARVRHFFAGDPFRPLEEIRSGTGLLLEAGTDEEFLRTLKPQLRPIGRRRIA